MRILIVGGSGFIGRHLIQHFLQQDDEVTVLTRGLNKKSCLPAAVSCVTQLSADLGPFEVIINLAGEPLDKHRWTPGVKEKIYQSRIETTQKVVEFIQHMPIKPAVFISGSAIGFYGDSEDQTFTEASAPAHEGFTHTLCRDWELEALKAEAFGVRVCLIRTGIVLDPKGGALARLLPAFKWGLGAQLGNGRQWMSWIHMADMVGAIQFLIDHPELQGAFNFTAPEPSRHHDFMKTLAQKLHRPFFLKLQPVVVKLLFGEMGETLLLKGQKVLPEELLKAGYQFQFEAIEKAI